MGWAAPTYVIAMCHAGAVRQSQWEESSAFTLTTIGIDLAKFVFQLHGVEAHGEVLF